MSTVHHTKLQVTAGILIFILLQKSSSPLQSESQIDPAPSFQTLSLSTSQERCCLEDVDILDAGDGHYVHTAQTLSSQHRF